MPVVPTRTGASVQQAPLTGGQLTGQRALQSNQRSAVSAELLSGNAEQLSQLGQGLSRAANDFDVIGERMATDEAFRAEVAIKSEWMKTDAELRKRYRGSAVTGYQEEASKWWQEAPSKFGAELSPRARNIASRSLQAARLQAESSSLNYFTAETEKSQNESWEAAKGVALQEALTDMRPEVVRTALKNLEQKNADFAATRGWTAEQLKLQNVKDANLLHTTVIGKMIDTDPVTAKAYYDANRDEIDATRHAKIEKDLKGAVNDVEGKKLADSLAGKPYDEVLVEIANIEDPERRKAASFHARQNQADIAAATGAREKAASDKVWQAVAQGARMSQLPRAMLEQMDGRERVQLNQHYEAEAKRRVAEAEGRPVKTNMAVLENIYSLSKDEFLKLKISTLGDKLSRADTEELIKRQAAMRDPKKLPEIVSMEQQIAATKAQLRLKNEDAGAFTVAVQRELVAAAKVAGKELDYDQRQKVIDRLTIQKGSWFGGGTRRFEVVGTKDQKDFDALPEVKTRLDEIKKAEQTEFAAEEVKKVPAAARAEIEAALKAKKKPVTPENIIDLYNRGQK